MNIEQYNRLRKIRDSLKKITQLSYNISQIDKRFPLESLDAQSIQPMLKVYTDFFNELKSAVSEISINLK
jgi:hypothetical protein